jgi:curved DNA-binding protein CbpA
MKENLYEILGVEREASKKEIKTAYRKLSKQHHPDKGGDPQLFIKIQVAYETLIDDDSRAAYDRDGSIGGGGVPLKTAAINIIMGLWDQILNYKCSAQNSDIDMDKVFLLKLRDIKKDNDRSIKQIKQTVKILKKICKGIVYKGTTNNLLKMFTEDKIKGGEDQIKKLERRNDEVEEAIKISKDYDYIFTFDEEECDDNGVRKSDPKLISEILNDFKF